VPEQLGQPVVCEASPLAVGCGRTFAPLESPDRIAGYERCPLRASGMRPSTFSAHRTV